MDTGVYAVGCSEAGMAEKILDTRLVSIGLTKMCMCFLLVSLTDRSDKL